MQRAVVIGCCGAGKSTLARALAERLGLARLELDSLRHQADWVPLDEASFRAAVARHLAEHERWVLDGNYTSLGMQELAWPRADTLIWLDLPRATCTASVLRRTLRRVITGEVLWNGNRERPRNLFSREPEQNVVLWAFTRHALYRERYARILAEREEGTQAVVRLQSRRAVERFLQCATTGG